MQQPSASTAQYSQPPPPEKMSQPLPSREIPPSLSPPPCAGPEWLGDDQIENEENFSIEALAGDRMGKLGKMKPERFTLKPSHSQYLQFLVSVISVSSDFTSVFIDTAPPSACTTRFGVS